MSQFRAEVERMAQLDAALDAASKDSGGASGNDSNKGKSKCEKDVADSEGAGGNDEKAGHEKASNADTTLAAGPGNAHTQVTETAGGVKELA